MFRIAICDDESIFVEELKGLISGYMMEKGLVFEIDTYSSGEALVKLGIERHPNDTPLKNNSHMQSQIQ